MRLSVIMSHTVLTADQITNKQRLLCCSLFYLAICLQTGSAKHDLIPLAFVESKIRVVNFRQVASLCLINLMNFVSTDVLRLKWR